MEAARSSKVTSVSSSAAHPHVPIPTGPAQPSATIADTISSLKSARSLADPDFERLRRDMSEVMIGRFVRLFQMQAMLDQPEHSRLQKTRQVPKKELEKELDDMEQELRHLGSWKEGLMKRIDRIRETLHKKNALEQACRKEEAPVKGSLFSRILKFLSDASKIQ